MKRAQQNTASFRTLRIPVRITKEEHAELKALCTEMQVTRSDLLEAFISDLTQSSRGCGENFEWWLEVRAFGHPFLSCYGRGDTPTTVSGAEIGRRLHWLGLWQEKARAERGTARSE